MSEDTHPSIVRFILCAKSVHFFSCKPLVFKYYFYFIFRLSKLNHSWDLISFPLNIKFVLFWKKKDSLPNYNINLCLIHTTKRQCIHTPSSLCHYNHQHIYLHPIHQDNLITYNQHINFTKHKENNEKKTELSKVNRTKDKIQIKITVSINKWWKENKSKRKRNKIKKWTVNKKWNQN